MLLSPESHITKTRGVDVRVTFNETGIIQMIIVWRWQYLSFISSYLIFSQISIRGVSLIGPKHGKHVELKVEFYTFVVILLPVYSFSNISRSYVFCVLNILESQSYRRGGNNSPSFQRPVSWLHSISRVSHVFSASKTSIILLAVVNHILPRIIFLLYCLD